MPPNAVEGVVDRVDGTHQEPIDLVPPGLRSWWSSVSARLTRPDRAAILLAIGQVPLLLLVLVPGSLYLDDLRAQSYAAGRSWWPFVIESNGTHFSPVARTLDWLHVQLAPLAHWPSVTITVLIRVGLVLVAWRLFRELFGPRAVLLLPLSLLVVTPTLLPVTAWYRQSITSLLVVIALCVAAQQHLRYLRTGDPRNLVGALLAIAGGLLTFEKAALISPWLVVLTAAAMPSGTSFRKRLRHVWFARVPLIASAVPIVLFLVVYLTGPYDKGATDGLRGTDVLGMMGRQISEALLPGLLGGPWRWTEASPYYGNPASPTNLIILGLLVTATLGLWCYGRNRRRAVWATVLFIAYYIPAAGMVAAGRLAAFGDGVALSYRLWPDVTFMAILCFCLAVLPLRAEVSEGRPPTRGSTRWLVAGAVVFVVIGSVVSTMTFVERWHANPTGDYLATLQEQLKQAPSRPVRLAPVALPAAVLPFWVDPDYSVEDVLAPTDGLATFHNVDGPVLVPDDSGRLAPLRLRQYAVAKPGPDGFCGYGVRPAESRKIPLPTTTPYYADEMVQLGVLANRATTLTVTVVSDSSKSSVVTRAPLTTRAGPHRFLARVPYDTRVTAIRVRNTDPQATICVVLAAVVVPEDLP